MKLGLKIQKHLPHWINRLHHHSPAQKIVKEIKSIGEIKANIEFADGINKNYNLDIQEIEVKKELAFYEIFLYNFMKYACKGSQILL